LISWILRFLATQGLVYGLCRSTKPNHPHSSINVSHGSEARLKEGDLGLSLHSSLSTDPLFCPEFVEIASLATRPVMYKRGDSTSNKGLLLYCIVTKTQGVGLAGEKQENKNYFFRPFRGRSLARVPRKKNRKKNACGQTICTHSAQAPTSSNTGNADNYCIGKPSFRSLVLCTGGNTI